ncbi:MAG: Rne/Rng family ribonuclease [Zetaproteobacteria bacterium]|nr:Rne/Rng family ribonuclease [Pseudobdellovibrionaceae bacterium]
MNKKLIINVNVSETRIALLEDNRLAEFHVERNSHLGLVGNVYKAKVSRVLPGMQSAFVNIGVDRAAFLFGGDVIDPVWLEAEKQRRAQEVDDRDPRTLANRTPIEHLIQDGDEILVQVAKEPLGTKGPRVTMLVTIPGRYLVLMPDFDNVGISRRIENEQIRDDLRARVSSIKPKNYGVIVRTAAADVDIELLKNDLNYLVSVWEEINKKKTGVAAPSLIYQEPDLILKTTRDLYTEEISEIIVDDFQAWSQIKHFLLSTVPGADDKLKFYADQQPVFDAYGLELDISQALSKKVWMPSGGYLVIEQTEALTSFDVNTGKFVGHKNAQQTILRTNLEAVRDIVYQLRLRNLGGIIIIDFIDMESESDRQKVNEALDEALRYDKARTNILGVNELGLVQMTRKRTSDSLERVLTDPCPHCEGSGRISTVETEANNLVRDIIRWVITKKSNEVRVKAREDVIRWFSEEGLQMMVELQDQHGVSVEFEKTKLDISSLREAAYEIIF